ncbi:spore germination protein GerPB [Bacillus dakarensis]|uniref:spore germination protein GerPB n=1 Tax=Robertmurraya dakarensis TaxID=1926278 RepID=UPI000982411F|nr:spore germination protein GerPB [Bacillus dakarensis]
MNFYIQQSIQINMIKIEGISNSSVFQIGSAGLIKPVSHLYNTGGFTQPAPEAEKPGTTSPQGLISQPAVPLGPPAAPTV